MRLFVVLGNFAVHGAELPETMAGLRCSIFSEPGFYLGDTKQPLLKDDVTQDGFTGQEGINAY